MTTKPGPVEVIIDVLAGSVSSSRDDTARAILTALDEAGYPCVSVEAIAQVIKVNIAPATKGSPFEVLWDGVTVEKLWPLLVKAATGWWRKP